jgi:hypothetical protein
MGGEGYRLHQLGKRPHLACFVADFTLMGWLLRICPLDRLNIALCKQTEALSNRCASFAATDCIELAVLLQACNRLH